MPTPIETVEAFLAAFAGDKAAMNKAFHDYFLPSTTWENVGMAVTMGPVEAIGLMANFDAMGMASMRVENHAISAQGNKVLTERTDHILQADGTPSAAIRVMGIFEVSDGKITAWRDYFDTVPFMAAAPAG